MHSRIFVVETDKQNTFYEDEIFEMIHGENHADYADEITDPECCKDDITDWFSAFDAKVVQADNGFDVSIPVSKISEYFVAKAKKIKELADAMENHPEQAASALLWQIEQEANDRYGIYLYMPDSYWFTTWTSAMWDLMRDAASNGQDKIHLHISQVFDYHY